MRTVVLLAAGVALMITSGAAVFAPRVYGSTASIVVSEVMWDGAEYLELHNSGVSDSSLEGWKLTRQQDGGAEKDMIVFSGGHVVTAGSYFLLERNEEATTIEANVIAGSLILVNTGELLRLYDAGGTVVDEINRFGMWFAGENTDTGVAMERISFDAPGTQDESWQTSLSSWGGRNGTPGIERSIQEGGGSPSPSPVPSQSYVRTIVINELLPNPQGADTEGEFIELSNVGSSTVSLTGWKLDDGETGSSPFVIGEGTELSAGGFVAFFRSQTGIALNNDGDIVRLLDPGGGLVSEIAYASIDEGNSLNRASNGIYEISTSTTPGGVNVIRAPVLKTPTPTTTTVNKGNTIAPSPSIVRTSLSPSRITGASSPVPSRAVAGIRAQTSPQLLREAVSYRDGDETSIRKDDLQISSTMIPSTIPVGTQDAHVDQSSNSMSDSEGMTKAEIGRRLALLLGGALLLTIASGRTMSREPLSKLIAHVMGRSGKEG